MRLLLAFSLLFLFCMLCEPVIASGRVDESDGNGNDGSWQEESQPGQHNYQRLQHLYRHPFISPPPLQSHRHSTAPPPQLRPVGTETQQQQQQHPRYYSLPEQAQHLHGRLITSQPQHDLLAQNIIRQQQPDMVQQQTTSEWRPSRTRSALLASSLTNSADTSSASFTSATTAPTDTGNHPLTSRRVLLGGASGRALSGINWPRGAQAEEEYERATQLFLAYVQRIEADGGNRRIQFRLSEKEQDQVGVAGEMLFCAMANRYRRSKRNARYKRLMGKSRKKRPGHGDDDDENNDDDEGNAEDEEGEEQFEESSFDWQLKQIRNKLFAIGKGKDGSIFTRQHLATILAAAAVVYKDKRRQGYIRATLRQFIELVPKIRHDWQDNVLAKYYTRYANNRPVLSDAALSPVLHRLAGKPQIIVLD